MTGRHTLLAGVGSALPRRVVPNEELERLVDTSDEWIFSRTGIRARRFAGDGETAATLGADAARAALEAAGVEPGAVDLTIVATVSGDQPLPSTASFVQERLGIGGAAFDLAAACAGFIYATDIGASRIAAGAAETVLVVGTEVLSRYLDLSDRTTCVLFGDGAGAGVLVPGHEPGVLGSILENDGRHARLLEIPAGGSARPASPETVAGRAHVIRMRDGREVFKRAVVGMADAAARLLDKAGLTPEDVGLLVPHQANARIIRAVADRLSFPMERVFLDLEDVGNTSAASVPIALDHAWRRGRLRPGDVVLTAAFGAGLAWGANLIRWTARAPQGAAR
ncbi:MAG TPA: beta-ketoacyl-ACP synthase III [Actinomycetota bacterium]|nr:beta-ketoacyl-ACP synthase III [Actinomycetota bacterium]